MNDKWYVLWWGFLRQIFCWHKLIFADADGIHCECKKCYWSHTNWELEAARCWNLYAQAVDALYKHEPDWKPRRVNLRDPDYPAEQSTENVSTGVGVSEETGTV